MSGESKPWLFKPGQSGNPKGKAKGTRNKINENFLRDTLAAWKKHGPTALDQAAQIDPMQFCKMVAGILPKHVEHRHSIIDELQQLPVEEMRRRLAEIRADREQPSH